MGGGNGTPGVTVDSEPDQQEQGQREGVPMALDTLYDASDVVEGFARYGLATVGTTETMHGELITVTLTVNPDGRPCVIVEADDCGDDTHHRFYLPMGQAAQLAAVLTAAVALDDAGQLTPAPSVVVDRWAYPQPVEPPADPTGVDCHERHDGVDR